MRYKNILFDIDGTLIDSGAALCRSFVKVMTEETGREVRAEEYARHWGTPGLQTFIDFGIVGEERIARGVERWDRYFREMQTSIPPFPGIEELLKELSQQGFVLGVVTSKTHKELDASFAPLSIANYLPHRVTSDDAKRPKPAPDPLLEIVKRLGAEKKDCLYVGDTIFDSRCAQDAEIDFALACWGLLFGEPEGVSAVAKLKQPKDVLTLAS
jgi:HAD superfamily hydrolase (TIGR01549 family)